MENEEKAREIIKMSNTKEVYDIVDFPSLEATLSEDLMEMAEWKDEQPISELGGWHTEPPTEDGWYLVDTPDFPKNCHCVVAEWDNDAKSFYDEHSDYPIKFHRWKLIERG